MSQRAAASATRMSRAEAGAALRRELGTGEGADLLALDSELLRSMVWALTGGGASAVHVNRLLNWTEAVEVAEVGLEAAPTDGASTDEGDEFSGQEGRRARLRASLEQLEELFDLVSLPGGYWLPSATRVVEVTQNLRMLVGGCPTSILPPELKATVEASGTFRRLGSAAVTTALALPVEALDSWLGPAPADLLVWGREVLAATVLEAYEPGAEVEDVTVYAPAVARPGAPQGFRWSELGSQITNGIYLARRRRVFGDQEKRVVEIKAGRIVRSGTPAVEGPDLRRFQYALDALAGNSTKARAKQLKAVQRFELKSELPRREQRLFATMGTLTTPPEKYYPRLWSFKPDEAERAREVLTSLHVEITDE